MTHEAGPTDSRVQRLARVLRDVRLPCADDIRRGDSVPAGGDVADVVDAMTVSDGQAMFGATAGNVRSSSKQCSEAVSKEEVQ